jgi:hypothetical protein
VKPILTLQEIAISLISIEKQGLLDLADLKQKEIIPSDWCISRSPSCSEGTSQMIFSNGLQIITNPNVLTFLEPLKINSSELRIPRITENYIKVFEGKYREAFTEVRSFITFEYGNTKSAHDYIKKLLSFDCQLSANLPPLQIELNLVYNLEDCRLTLKITETKLDLPGGQVIPAVLVSCKFLYGAVVGTSLRELSNLSHAVNQSNRSLEVHRQFLYKNFEIKCP